MEQQKKVLIIDYGSPLTQLVARKVREAGVYSEILPCTAPFSAVEKSAPTAIILSGCADNISDTDAPPFDKSLLEYKRPILAIGYAMRQVLKTLGGTLVPAQIPKQSSASEGLCEMWRLSLDKNNICPLWHDIPEESSIWASLGETPESLPKEFTSLGSSACTLTPESSKASNPAEKKLVAFGNAKRKIYGLAFHPEAAETECGTAILRNFLFNIAGLEANWNMKAFVENAVHEAQQQVGQGKVVLGLSGGVDSSVVAALLHLAIGDRLHCIFVDHGLMRLNEGQEVTKMLKDHMPDLNLHYIEAQDLFLGRLAGVEDPEQKRKIIGYTFIEVFEKEAKAIEGAEFLGQGTIYPDVIESYSPKGIVIKSHHNVGGLPETMHLKLVEPLKELFKDEVRAVALELGLPEDFIHRHPFPGPGLGVRVIGSLTTERLDTLRRADAIVREEIHSFGWQRKVWQAFAVLLPLRTVGVRNHQRTYENVVAIRAINSLDAMTADWARLPYELIEKMVNRILAEVPGVNRVVYDVSPKPPSTIEWE